MIYVDDRFMITMTNPHTHTHGHSHIQDEGETRADKRMDGDGLDLKKRAVWLGKV